MSRATPENGPKTEGIVIHAASYYEVLTKVLFLGRERAFREATLDLASLEPGQDVLDVGCGPGTLALAAKKRIGAGTMCGVDPAPKMIERARWKAGRAGVEADFRVGVIEDLPFENESFDVVLSSLMLHHLPFDLRRKGLTEVHRVLRPGGVCLIVDLEIDGPGILARFKGHFARSRRSSEESNGDLLQNLGFDVTTGRTPHRLIRYARGVKSS